MECGWIDLLTTTMAKRKRTTPAIAPPTMKIRESEAVSVDM